MNPKGFLFNRKTHIALGSPNRSKEERLDSPIAMCLRNPIGNLEKVKEVIPFFPHNGKNEVNIYPIWQKFVILIQLSPEFYFGLYYRDDRLSSELRTK
tara:strand:+ start:1345 stop:1638 length:294 start_codon:yes stop_codon:yes gene_type:complete